jgi:uncharacterized membrane protein YphA (DoxX/SURF4 family)
MMGRERIVDLILRVGLAFSFLYPPLDALVDPYTWIGYFPSFMHGYVPDMVLLHGFGTLEVVVALWLLSGWKIFWPSLVALVLLLAIVVFDNSDFQILFRDLTIASIAFALIIWHFPWSSSAV